MIAFNSIFLKVITIICCLVMASVANADSSTPIGTWYLLANGHRLEANISASGSSLSGTIKNESAQPDNLSHISWDPVGRWLMFRRNGSSFYQWYKVSLVEGVINGRFSHSNVSTLPSLTSFSYHVTGWSPNYLDNGLYPRTWRLTINENYEAIIRIDLNSSGNIVGRLKVFDNNAVNGSQEQLEDDLTSIAWDGTTLRFTRKIPGGAQVYTGTTNGRFISGTFLQNGVGPYSWSGSRSQVMGFGLGSRLPQRTAWQATTRARLVNMTEGMRLISHAVPSIEVTEVACSGCPFTGGNYPPGRDDNPNGWPPNYTLKRLRFRVAPGSRFDPASSPPPREFYGYLAVPTASPPAGGFRAVVAVNGHGGSAEKVMTKSHSLFWHGESAARRYLVVLALDIGHRPEWMAGDISHPAIVSTGYLSSDWEEEGERAFSVRRAVDYLVNLTNVNENKIFIEGLSMGGEVTTIVGGLDTRFGMVMPAGYSPDMHVMDFNGNHPCYRWKNSDIHEYIDVSDYLALVAPRPLVVQTGLQDFEFSKLPTPFSSDKQVIRRARAAYGSDSSKVIHYLHYDGHAFHVGDQNPVNSVPGRQGIRASTVLEPVSPGDTSWQTSSATTIRSPNLYELMNELLP